MCCTRLRDFKDVFGQSYEILNYSSITYTFCIALFVIWKAIRILYSFIRAIIVWIGILCLLTSLTDNKKIYFHFEIMNFNLIFFFFYCNIILYLLFIKMDKYLFINRNKNVKWITCHTKLILWNILFNIFNTKRDNKVKNFLTNLKNYQKIAKLDFERYFKEEKHEITKSKQIISK